MINNRKKRVYLSPQEMIEVYYSPARTSDICQQYNISKTQVNRIKSGQQKTLKDMWFYTCAGFVKVKRRKSQHRHLEEFLSKYDTNGKPKL